ncbi:CaiB/BaiF CoA transferase family protein [Chloroflexota bacterium]
MTTKKALSGVRVVEYGNFISAPYCTKLMADLGAEVIKVESPDFPDKSRKHGPFLDDIPHPERSGLFLYLNTSKLDITLNLETASGREIFMRLLKDADIFVENNPVQRVKDLGIDYDSVKEVNPLLIMTSITPFGQTGPYRDYKAYDINVQAAGGVTQMIGMPDREPLAIPLSQGQYQVALCAAVSSLIGLWARQANGQGQHIDVAETEVLATIHTGWDVLNYIFQWREVRRTGHHGAEFPYPNAILPCKDGYVFVGANRKWQWEKLLELMGNPEWANDPMFKNRTQVNTLHSDEADALIAPWLMERTGEELFKLCNLENRLPFAPVKSIDKVLADPQLAARGFFQDINRAETGVLKYPQTCYRFSETSWQVERPAPLLGEHNELIYCDRLGYSREELVKLRQCGII